MYRIYMVLYSIPSDKMELKGDKDFEKEFDTDFLSIYFIHIVCLSKRIQWKICEMGRHYRNC